MMDQEELHDENLLTAVDEQLAISDMEMEFLRMTSNWIFNECTLRDDPELTKQVLDTLNFN